MNGYRTLARQLNEDALSLMDLLTVSVVLKENAGILPRIYREFHRSDLAVQAEEQIAMAQQNFTKFQEKLLQKNIDRKGTHRVISEHGGLLAANLPIDYQIITPETLKPELKVNYAILDQGLLLLQLLLWLPVLAFGFVLWLFRRRPGDFLALPSRRETLHFLWQVLALPLAGYFLITRIDLFSGRDYSLQKNLPLIVLQTIYLVGIMPLWALMVSRNMIRRHLSVSVSPGRRTLLWGNLILPMVFFFSCNALVVWGGLRLEQHCYITKDKLIFADMGIGTGSEQYEVNLLRESYCPILEELERRPLRLREE